ncbi:hypothetical protein HDF08_000293 [Edaphobacter lichenicola]|uniref:Uncharacterized protein n=1 Tax=Tunturiibacter lichenicola TaxID=2051959 RepID=A0A852VFK6_9BACT|nr:hypothetical protein [Edaphobacter lichenicola]
MVAVGNAEGFLLTLMHWKLQGVAGIGVGGGCTL